MKYKVMSRQICRGEEDIEVLGIFDSLEKAKSICEEAFEEGWGSNEDDEDIWVAGEMYLERIEELYPEDGRKGWVCDVDEEMEYWIIELN